MRIVLRILIDIKCVNKRMWKHYKTTVFGAIAAASNMIANHLLTQDGKVNWPVILTSFALFFIGALSADYDKASSK